VDNFLALSLLCGRPIVTLRTPYRYFADATPKILIIKQQVTLCFFLLTLYLTLSFNKNTRVNPKSALPKN